MGTCLSLLLMIEYLFFLTHSFVFPSCGLKHKRQMKQLTLKHHQVSVFLMVKE